MLTTVALRAVADLSESYPTLRSDLEGCDHEIVCDIRGRLNRYGSISPKQAALVVKLAAEARKPPEVHVPAPEGRVTFEGEIISLKEYENNFGCTWKMTLKVRTEAGTWLAWMTVPQKLWDAVDGPLKGRHVCLTATLTRGQDNHFALGKRPTLVAVR